MDNIHITSLDKHHDRLSFNCGIEQLNRYLKHHASQDVKRYLSKVYVAAVQDSPQVIGFYTLSACRIDVGELPEEISSKLPYYSYVPAILIGRLAVDQEYQNKGLGRFLLMDALYKYLNDNVGSMAVIVEAKNDIARAFYKKLGFLEFHDHTHKLFIHMAQIKLLFS